MNWNYINNTLSDAVVKSGNLEALVAELGCHLRGQPGGSVFRGPCPVHRGDGLNFEVRTDGDILPINWRCFSRACHKTGKLKPSLLGLVRGALTGDPDRPASLPNARQYIEKFLVCHGTRPCFRPPAPTVHRASNSLALSREVVRGQLILPSPYFVARGFNPVVLDRFDIGESRKLGRAIVPVFDERGVTCIGFISRSVLPYCSRCRRCHAKTAKCGVGELRWKVPTDFARSEWLFNHAVAKKAETPFVLLVEGVPDVLRAAEAGAVAVAGFGNDLSTAQVGKLVSLDKRVVVAFDNDNAGRSGAESTVRLLRREGVRADILHPPVQFKDVGEMATTDVKEWMLSA